VRCLGSRDQDGGKAAPCDTVLHFKMSLTFKTKSGVKRPGKARKSIKKPSASQSQQ